MVPGVSHLELSISCFGAGCLFRIASVNYTDITETVLQVAPSLTSLQT